MKQTITLWLYVSTENGFNGQSHRHHKQITLLASLKHFNDSFYFISLHIICSTISVREDLDLSESGFNPFFTA